MNANVWLIVVVVLVALFVILAIMDRSFLSPMYLSVLALVVMVGTSANSRAPRGRAIQAREIIVVVVQ